MIVLYFPFFSKGVLIIGPILSLFCIMAAEKTAQKSIKKCNYFMKADLY
jgi:hypothetical protein